MKYRTNPAAAGELRHLRDVEPFQEILELLVRFDEQTGRLEKNPELETHYMRKAICHAKFLIHYHHTHLHHPHNPNDPSLSHQVYSNQNILNF